jgi:NADPH2:quinone reductase
MTHAIRIHETGGPEVMRWESVELNAPEAGEVQVRNTAVGLNYIDTYHRSGLYPLPLPSLLGQEGAGVVESVGSGVSGLRAGDRVAYATGPIGAYCEVRNYPADKLVKLPSGISDEIAATIMLKGMTAEYLLHRTAHVQSGDVILLHAAAGGTGVLVAQWAAEMGVTVIGVVSSEEKAEIARQHGCQHVLISGADNLAAQVLEITNGKGVKVDALRNVCFVRTGLGADSGHQPPCLCSKEPLLHPPLAVRLHPHPGVAGTERRSAF